MYFKYVIDELTRPGSQAYVPTAIKGDRENFSIEQEITRCRWS